MWCAQVIETLRSLGLTIEEIDQLASAYLRRPDESIGPRLAAFPDTAERRIEDRIAELGACRERIREYRAQNAGALAGRRDAGLFGADPRAA